MRKKTNKDEQKMQKVDENFTFIEQMKIFHTWFSKINAHCVPHIIYIFWVLVSVWRWFLIFDAIFEDTQKICCHSTFHIFILTDIFEQCEQDIYPICHSEYVFFVRIQWACEQCAFDDAVSFLLPHRIHFFSFHCQNRDRRLRKNAERKNDMCVNDLRTKWISVV